METTKTSSSTPEDTSSFAHPLPEYVDWIVGVAIAIGGMALTVAGSATTFVVDRGLLEEGMESGQITVVVVERDLTEAQMLELSLELVNWIGIGLLLTSSPP